MPLSLMKGAITISTGAPDQPRAGGGFSARRPRDGAMNRSALLLIAAPNEKGHLRRNTFILRTDDEDRLFSLTRPRPGVA
jgi:hypothetical protein